MNHHQCKRRQQSLFDLLPQIRLVPELRQAVLPVLAELIAAVLRQPDQIRREGGPRDDA